MTPRPDRPHTLQLSTVERRLLQDELRDTYRRGQDDVRTMRQDGAPTRAVDYVDGILAHLARIIGRLDA